MTRYIFETRAINVEEKFTAGVQIKGADDKWTEGPKISLGWFVRISDSSSIGVGPDRPDIASGDKVRITLERMR